MVNAVATAFFCMRNGEKTEEGHMGRAAVLAGQAKNLFDYITTLDNKYSHGLQNWTQDVRAYSEGNTVLKGAGKVLNFAAKNVNPLLCLSAGIDVAFSDDKVTTAVESSTGLALMFGTEKIMKGYLTKEGEEKLAKDVLKLFKMKSKGIAGFIAQLAFGGLFAAGSIGFYELGHKFGEVVMKKNNK